MELNYKVTTWEVSLESACLVKVVHTALQVSSLNRDWDWDCDWRSIEDDAVWRMKCLKLPCSQEEAAIALIPPITDELRQWYKERPSDFIPILTSYGTVDKAESLRAVLKSNLSIKARFEVACIVCDEEAILELGRETVARKKMRYANMHRGPLGRFWHRTSRSPRDKWPGGEGLTSEVCDGGFYDPILPSSPLACFWYRLYKGRFDEQQGGEGLTSEECDAGLEMAVESREHLAIAYFANRASPSAVERVLGSDHILTVDFAPETYVLFFSRMTEIRRRELKELFCFKILDALLSWPYQHLFLEAADSLVDELHAQCYFQIATTIILMEAEHGKTYDYRALFAAYWALGANLRNKETIGPVWFHKLLYHLYIDDDEQLVDLVLKDMSAGVRTKQLVEYPYNNKSWVCMLPDGNLDSDTELVTCHWGKNKLRNRPTPE